MSRSTLSVFKPIVKAYCHPDQRAYLQDRDITENIAITNRWLSKGENRERRYCVLIDFSNAFSSLGHDFIRDYLRRAGLPEPLIRLLCYPLNTHHTIIVDGQQFEFISCQTGSRQGDALAGFVFIFILESLLARLRRVVLGNRNPDAAEHLRSFLRALAFADDLGLLLRRLLKGQWAEIVDIFEQFTRASNLQVNISKTFVVSNRSTFSGPEIAKFSESAWGDMSAQCVTMRKYLGIQVGFHASVRRIFQDAIAKFDSQLLFWQDQPLSFEYKFLVVNVFLHSLFSYICSLFIMPSDLVTYVNGRCLRFISRLPWTTGEADIVPNPFWFYNQLDAARSISVERCQHPQENPLRRS